MKHPKIKLSIEEQLANKIAGIAAVEMRTLAQQLAYWVATYEAKNGVVSPKPLEKVGPRPMAISPERRAKMREQGFKLALAAKAKAAERKAASNGLAH
jgi:hypothetical protein